MNPALQPEPSLVLYALIREPPVEGEPDRYLLIDKRGLPAFPPTKMRPGEDLYAALVRPMEEDLGLPDGSYYPETQVESMPFAGTSPVHTGLADEWFLYPVTVSLTAAGWEALNRLPDLKWWSLDEIVTAAPEPNIVAIAGHLQANPTCIGPATAEPSMQAVACRWAADNEGSARVVRGADIERILAAGDRAFNLRVSDPYLPYQCQGLEARPKSMSTFLCV